MRLNMFACWYSLVGRSDSGRAICIDFIRWIFSGGCNNNNCIIIMKQDKRGVELESGRRGK